MREQQPYLQSPWHKITILMVAMESACMVFIQANVFLLGSPWSYRDDTITMTVIVPILTVLSKNEISWRRYFFVHYR